MGSMDHHWQQNFGGWHPNYPIPHLPASWWMAQPLKKFLILISPAKKESYVCCENPSPWNISRHAAAVSGWVAPWAVHTFEETLRSRSPEPRTSEHLGGGRAVWLSWYWCQLNHGCFSIIWPYHMENLSLSLSLFPDIQYVCWMLLLYPAFRWESRVWRFSQQLFRPIMRMIWPWSWRHFSWPSLHFAQITCSSAQPHGLQVVFFPFPLTVRPQR